MRLLLDENISPIIGAALTDAGHDVCFATSACPGAFDIQVIAVAAARDAILVIEPVRTRRRPFP